MCDTVIYDVVTVETLELTTVYVNFWLNFEEFPQIAKAKITRLLRFREYQVETAFLYLFPLAIAILVCRCIKRLFPLRDTLQHAHDSISLFHTLSTLDTLSQTYIFATKGNLSKCRG